MTFEKHLDIEIMFDDIFVKCKTKEELENMLDELEWIMQDVFQQRLEEIEEGDDK